MMGWTRGFTTGIAADGLKRYNSRFDRKKHKKGEFWNEPRIKR
jgi:hypothetical protein